MNKKYYFYIILIFMFITACNKDHMDNCIDAVITELGMDRYRGEELNCRTFLRLYKFEGKDYFLLDNYCADMVSYPFDCEGNEACGIGKEVMCQKFYDEAVEIKIIAIKK